MTHAQTKVRATVKIDPAHFLTVGLGHKSVLPAGDAKFIQQMARHRTWWSNSCIRGS